MKTGMMTSTEVADFLEELVGREVTKSDVARAARNAIAWRNELARVINKEAEAKMPREGKVTQEINNLAKKLNQNPKELAAKMAAVDPDEIAQAEARSRLAMAGRDNAFVLMDSVQRMINLQIGKNDL